MASLHSSARARAVALICLALAFSAMAAHLTSGDSADAAPVSGAAADALGIDPAATEPHEALEAAPLLIEQDADDVPSETPTAKAATDTKTHTDEEAKEEVSKDEHPAEQGAKEHPKEEAAKDEHPAEQGAKEHPKEEAVKDEHPAEEGAKEHPKEEAVKDEHPAEQGAKEHPKEEAAKDEHPAEQGAKEHPKEEAAKDEHPAEQGAKEHPKEEAVKDEHPAEESAQEHPKEEAAKDEHPAEESAQEHPKEEAQKDKEKAQEHPKEEAAKDSLKIIEAPVKDGKPAFLMEDHALPIVSLQFSFPGGGYAHVPEKFAGASSLAVSALDEGAGKYTPSDFKRLLQRLHAEVNFSADEDGLYVTLTTLTSGLDKSVEILADLLAAPAYEKADLPRHIGAVLTAIQERDSDPAQAGMAELKKRVWGTHPYARDALGTTESVKRVTPAQLRSYHKEAVNPGVLRVAAAGDVTAEALSALTDRFSEKLRAGSAKPSGPAFLIADLPAAPYLPETFERLHIERDIPQTIVLFALPAVTRNDPAFFNYYVANYLLGGGGFESRLMHKLREEKAYAYSVNTGLAYGLKGAMLAGSAGVSSANADAFLTELKAILDSGEPYGEEEISAAKSHMERAFALGLSNNAAQAGMLAGLQLYGFGPDYMNVRLQKLAEVTPESLGKILNAAWRGDKMISVTVGRSGKRAEPLSAKQADVPAAEAPASAAPAPAKPQEEKHQGRHHKRGHHSGR